MAKGTVVSLPAVHHSAVVVNGSRDAIPEIGGDIYDYHRWNAVRHVRPLPKLVSGREMGWDDEVMTWVCLSKLRVLPGSLTTDPLSADSAGQGRVGKLPYV